MRVLSVQIATGAILTYQVLNAGNFDKLPKQPLQQTYTSAAGIDAGIVVVWEHIPD